MTTVSAVRAPSTRPALARTSSAASGLRFCGMIDEPVVKASDSLTKPNCGVVHSTISSARRERCTAVISAADSASRAKSRAETRRGELAVGPIEAQRLGGHLAVDRERRAGQRRGAQRALVHPRAGVGEARRRRGRTSRHRPSGGGRRSPAGRSAGG